MDGVKGKIMCAHNDILSERRKKTYFTKPVRNTHIFLTSERYYCTRMPRGHDFSREEKSLIFNVIRFVENEKSGPTIPLFYVRERLVAMLGISLHSVNNLKHEMLTGTVSDESMDESTYAVPTRKSNPLPDDTFIAAATTQVTLPNPVLPKKRGHSGRSSIRLSEYGEDMIRYQFNLMLAEKIYPTIDKLLSRLQSDCQDFPIHSHTTLSKIMKELGFKYCKTSKATIPLDSTFFIAQRAYYFRKLNEFRGNGTLLFWHDETWVNSAEEKHSIWINDSGQGRLRKRDGKGEYLS